MGSNPILSAIKSGFIYNINLIIYVFCRAR
jgi:hypothetical protein